MSTFCHGIASCQVLDKSAEIVDIKGLDITSLPKSGILNYEHRSDIPGQICGKILTAKKIYSKDDCSNDHEEYFWNKCKAPFVYITAELLDDYCQSGKDAAGVFRYDHDKKDQNSNAILGFSVEGSEIPNTRKGQLITRSIARKVTLTSSPCNSLCIAELLETAPESQVKDDFDSIFKNTEEAITLFKSGEGVKIYETYLAKKEAEGPSQGGKPPKSPSAEYQGHGIQHGKTKGGEAAYSHGHIAPYKFNPAEHQEGGEFHEHANVMAKNPKLQENKQGRMKMNATATAAGGRRENRAALSLNDKNNIVNQQGKQLMAKNEKVCELHKGYEKGVHTSLAATTAPGSKNSKDKTLQGMSSMGYNVRNPRPTMVDPKVKASQNLKDLKRMPKPNLGKSEPKGWSPAKVDKKAGAVHWNHPNHGYVSIVKQPTGEFHVKHRGGLAGIKGVKGVFSTSKEAGKHARSYMSGLSNGTVAPPPSHVELKKAIEAGSYNAAPSTLTNGAAYQTESMGSKQATTGAEDHNFQATKKKDWNKKANEEYDRWPHKDKFENFMKARMPHLASGEIRAIGKLLSLKKSLELHKAEPKVQEHMPVHHDEFHHHLTQARSVNPQVKEFTHLYEPHEYSKMKTYLHPDKKSGFAVKPDGDIVSLFSTEKKRGDQLVQHAKKAGGNKLDAFEGYLTNSLYPKHGFKETHREKNWTAGKPDVVYMGLNHKPMQKSEDTKKELDEKSLKDIQKETAEKWADRAVEAYKKAIAEKSVKWLMDAIEYGHEAIEHSSLGEDLAVFEKIRAKIMPIHKEAIELLAPGAAA